MTTPIDIHNFRHENICFGKPFSCGNPGTFRIPIFYKIAENNNIPLIILTPELFSFGVSPQVNKNETLSPDLRNVHSFSLPLCLYSKNGPTEEEIQFTNVIDLIVDEIKKYCVTDKFNLKIQKYGEDKITMEDLKKMNPKYQKKEKGQETQYSNPLLYPRLVFHKKTERFLTEFYNSEGDVKTNPLEIIGKRMKAKCALRIESIFVGSKISLQIKVCHVNFKKIEKTRLIT